MGAWGFGALDNDSAADWFGGLFGETKFRDRVVAGLDSDSPEQVRAAAWVIARLGRVYVWPIESLDQDRIQAAAGLLRLQHDEDWLEMWDGAEQAVGELTVEINALELSPEELGKARAAAGLPLL